MIKRIIFDLDNTLIMWKDEYEKAADIALNVINYPKTNDLYKKINASIKKANKDGLVNSMIHVTNALKVVGVDIKRKVFSDIYENLGGNLRFIVSAAAPIDAKVGKWVEDIGIIFLQGYGLTETAPIAALTPEYQTKVGSAGKAIPKGKIKIEDPNENGEGEVLIKTPTLMLGYYEDEEATKSVIEEINGERWFHSGDIGYLDKDGFLYITGRSKNNSSYYYNLYLCSKE